MLPVPVCLQASDIESGASNSACIRAREGMTDRQGRDGGNCINDHKDISFMQLEVSKKRCW